MNRKRPKPKARNRKNIPNIENDYLQVFVPRPLLSQGLYTDEDSLEQPSELQDVPSTSAPSVEA